MNSKLVKMTISLVSYVLFITFLMLSLHSFTTAPGAEIPDNAWLYNWATGISLLCGYIFWKLATKTSVRSAQ